MALKVEFRDNIRFFEAIPNTPEDDVTYLLLHGLGNSLDFWLEVAPALGASRRTIAIDIPGFGRSSSPAGGFTLNHVSTAISKFCESLNISKCVLVAHSMGAFVALQLMALHSGRFCRLILVDGTLGRVTRLARCPGQVLQDPKLAVYVLAQFAGGVIPIRRPTASIITYSRIVRDLTLWPYLADPGRADPSVLAPALADNGGLAVLKVLAEARRVDYVALMQAVRSPVDLVWGTADRLINHQDVEQARELMSIDRELEIESCGHWPMIERPGVLTDFILSSEQHTAVSAAKGGLS